MRKVKTMSKTHIGVRQRFIRTLLLLLSVTAGLSWALTQSGVVIKNQASAIYTDADGVEHFVTSNIVETVVQPVAGVTLVQDATRYVSTTGGTVSIPHVLTNTGNTSDSYNLTLTNLAGAGFDFTSIEIFLDSNQDGQADTSTPLDLSGAADTPLLAPGESWYFVVTATVPAGEAVGDQDQYRIDATSTCTCNAAPGESLTASNTDTVIVTNQAVISLIKSISESSGPSPSSPTSYRYTLTYTNSGDSAATDVILTDAIPAGLTYVAGSARWSMTGTTVLTDSNPDDPQGGGPTIRYCAALSADFVSNCQNVSTPLMPLAQAPGNVINPDGTTYSAAWQLGAVISSIAAGETATLTFQFTVDGGLSAQTLFNVAEVLFDADGTAGNEHFYSNIVAFNVETSVGVVANNSGISSATGVDDSSDTGNIVEQASVAQGQTVTFSNFIWNTGNTADSFDIEIYQNASGDLLDREGNVLTNAFPDGTTFLLLKPDGSTPLIDTNGNGIPDTGPVTAGGVYEVVLKATLPYEVTGDNSGAGWAVTKRATSTVDDSLSNTVTDRVLQIEPAVVDLTNAATLNANCTGTVDAGLGAGVGPEAAAVTTLDINPGESCAFQLLVNNEDQTSPQSADHYDLAAGSWDGSNFTANDLADGITVTFHEDGGAGDCSSLGAAINNTDTLLPGAQKLVCAQVSIDESVAVDIGAAAGANYDIYFQVRSPLTGATDIKHDAVYASVDLAQQMGLSLEPNQFGQTDPGSIIVYDHIVLNTGNVDLECINVSGVNDLEGQGWTLQFFEDVDENAELTEPDIPLTDFSLAVGAEKFILVRIYVPTDAAMGEVNITNLSITGYADNGDGDPAICDTSAANQTTDSAVDQTTVARTDIVITKEQALDADCDGSLDGPGTCSGDSCFTQNTFNALPGQDCIIYRLTAINNGLETVQSVVISDATPNFTIFYDGGALALPTVDDGNVVGGLDGTYGMVEGGAVSGASVELAPGNSLEMRFGVRVE